MDTIFQTRLMLIPVFWCLTWSHILLIPAVMSLNVTHWAFQLLKTLSFNQGMKTQTNLDRLSTRFCSSDILKNYKTINKGFLNVSIREYFSILEVYLRCRAQTVIMVLLPACVSTAPVWQRCTCCKNLPCDTKWRHDTRAHILP